MIMLALQTFLLMAIAFVLGCILGCLLHRLFGSASKAAAVVAPVAALAAAPRITPPAPPPPPMPRVAPEAAPKAASVAAPLAAKPKQVAATKKVSKPKPAPKPVVKAYAKDDLKRIRGIGPQNEVRLNAIGVTAFDQIAAWSAREQAEIGDRLAFPGRIEREEWVNQAKVLAKGGNTAFSKRVDKGEVESSMGKVPLSDLGRKPPIIAKARAGKGDNLTLIGGVGNAIEKKLNALGIYHFDQVAAWIKANEVWIGNEIGFPGRPERENWVKEAGILAAGGTTDHAKRVEEGKIGTSRKSKPGENK